MPYDRWHKSHPKAGESACREHRKVPTADHGVGKRWQARWRNREGIQQTELFRTEAEARRHAGTQARNEDAVRGGRRVVHRSPRRRGQGL